MSDVCCEVYDVANGHQPTASSLQPLREEN